MGYRIRIQGVKHEKVNNGLFGQVVARVQRDLALRPVGAVTMYNSKEASADDQIAWMPFEGAHITVTQDGSQITVDAILLGDTDEAQFEAALLSELQLTNPTIFRDQTAT